MMTPRRQRMIFVGVMIAGVAAAAALIVAAIGENMLYFFSPTPVRNGEAPAGRTLRVGGLVVPGSIQRDGESLEVSFDLTDNSEVLTVRYTGILPDLFREGQGIVAIGAMNADGSFFAEQVLAKHDEKYMPPEVAEALKMAEQGGRMPMPHGAQVK
ncbi:MAG: cytochrome c maturation protein CcmE [Gammaproteobacteria bacterium]|nr:cytochrome c maturation protein CcmE [Gammaproteobacteria bacterium]